MVTNVPKPTFGPRGFIAPLEQDILAGRMLDINGAFGGNLNADKTTPQGQMGSSDAAILGFVNDAFLNITNQFNPNLAFGRWQDGLAAIYFITRLPATSTVVQALCVGAVGTPIPLGSLAMAVDGNVYTCSQDGVIGADGTVTLEFTCNAAGPIPCTAGSLNTIYQTIPGWDTITNVSDGVVGQDVETRQAFEERRFQSVAKNSLGALPSVKGEVLGVPGVLDAYVTENPTASPVTVGGVTLAPKSIYVAVVGGTADDVASAIWRKKSPGCDYNGNTTVTVYDKSYDPPYPSYAVTFEIPDPTPILFSVNLADNAQVPDDAAAQVRAAIIATFNGANGSLRARIGSTIYASRFYGAVAALGSWVQIISIQIGCQNYAAASCLTGSVAGVAFTEAGGTTGAFAAGQTLVGAGVVPGTTIVSGTSPNWVVSIAQTVAARKLYGVLADRNDVVLQIDQSPTLSPDNIAVAIT